MAGRETDRGGGRDFFDLGEDQDKENFERKFKDPDGTIFDISRKGWIGAGRLPCEATPQIPTWA